MFEKCEFCGKWDLEKCEFCEKRDFENVNFVKKEIFRNAKFVKNGISEMWILWKMGFRKWEFCKKRDFESVHFVKKESSLQTFQTFRKMSRKKWGWPFFEYLRVIGLLIVSSQPCLPFEVDFCGLPVEDALIICRPPRNNTRFGSVTVSSATLIWSRSGWPILGVCCSTGDSSAARTRLQAKDVLLTCQLFCNGHNWAGNQKSLQNYYRVVY